jgi:hypothetical protein
VVAAVVPSLFVLLMLRLPKRPSTPEAQRSNGEKLADLDFLGLTALAPAVFCLLLGLQWGGSTYAWSDPRIIVLLTLSPILFVAFGLIQWKKQEKAMIPPRLTRNLTLMVGAAYAFFLSAGLAIVQYYVSQRVLYRNLLY